MARSRVTNYATIAFVMFVCSLVSSTCYIIHDRGAYVNSYFKNFKKKFSDNLIIDEAQNMTPNQVKGIITRAGQGTKIILLGDYTFGGRM